jgi:hypothetical protein
VRTPGIQLEPRNLRRLWASVASAALHLALLLVIALFGGRREAGDAAPSPAMQIVSIETADSSHAESAPSSPSDPAVSKFDVEMQLNVAVPTLQMASEAVATPSVDESPPAPLASSSAETEAVVATRRVESVPAQAATFEIEQTERAKLSERLARSAQESSAGARTQVAWEENGKQYSAILTREPALHGMALERVAAEVTVSENGRDLKTSFSMKRLAFSQFTQVIDRWDPFVQLHDDEIVGRFHSNTAFNMMYDGRTAPKFSGKVTTAARNYSATTVGRRRDKEIFKGGFETHTGRIDLPSELLPFNAAALDAKARIHKLADDVRITFFKDGSYAWRGRDASSSGYLNEPSADPVYFIAAQGATVHVKGTVAGKILVYSPERIVIEGNLRYARDPREVPDSPDYLGLMCDKVVSVAAPFVTGSGDLTIDAAIFARRRFVVTEIDHPRSATLTIYGSLTAGTISATEPRYATKIDYDPRFERLRPPGFPSTDRYEVETWDAQWIQVAGDTQP